MNQSENWLKILPRIQSLISNFKSNITTKTSNKVVFAFISNWLLDLLADSIGLDYEVAQIKAKDAISFVQINYKHYYNCFHQSINLKVNNFALLHFHKRYSIPTTLDITKKLTQ